MTKSKAVGKLIRAFGNLLHVQFEGDVRQGEIAMVELGDLSLKAEVIEIAGDEVKLQVFEDISGVELFTPVKFTSHLLEAELGPGLISTIFDGLQNPLERVADSSGLFLDRGNYVPSLDRTKKWNYEPKAKENDFLRRGDVIGIVLEGRFQHKIMVPFSFVGKYQVVWLKSPGNYTIDTPIAKLKDEKGNEHDISMVQKWPVKVPLIEGKK